VWCWLTCYNGLLRLGSVICILLCGCVVISFVQNKPVRNLSFRTYNAFRKCFKGRCWMVGVEKRAVSFSFFLLGYGINYFS
jgi:hypothetical protein